MIHPLDLSIEATKLDLFIEEETGAALHFENCLTSGTSFSSLSSGTGSSSLSSIASLTSYACFVSTGS